MTLLFIIASIGFFFWIVRNILFWVSLWQSKEYRFDRLSVHLRETLQGKRLLTSPLFVIKWFLLLFYVVIVFQDKLTPVYQLAITLLYVFECLIVCNEIRGYHQFKRPARTAKAYAIVVLTFILILTLYFIPMTDMFVWLLILDCLTIVCIGVFVFFFSFPTEMYTDFQIQKARQKLQRYKKLLVIAVSGSYGKSSTKEYIAHVLSEKFSVVKTLGSNNTPIGIAKTILNKIDNNTDIFVVEMGAYKRGEVAELCDIVRPAISVTTSVSDQHLSLYGNLKNAIDTELELIHALPKNGLALFNGNNKHTSELYKKCKKKKILYKASLQRNEQVDVAATNIMIGKNDVSFTVAAEGKRIHIQAPLLGGHMIENLLPAVYLAKYLGIPDAKIKKAFLSVTPPPKTMIQTGLPGGIVAVDDTFNISPESVQAVLQYMKIYKKKKILVLMPMIELGKNAKDRHREIGKMIGAICDNVFLTNKNFYKEILRGVTMSKGNCVVQTAPAHVIAREVMAIAEKGDIVVFEGKEAGIVLGKLKM